MRVALVLVPTVVDDVHLAAHDRLDPLFLGGLVEIDRARERPVVGERDGRHLVPGSLCGERRDPARAVEDRVLGVDVQVDEVGWHGVIVITPSSDMPPGPRGRHRVPSNRIPTLRA